MPIVSNFPGIGMPGANGKSAYQSAVENGYTGTEQEFNAALSNIGNTAAEDVSFVPGATGLSNNLQDAVTELFTDVSNGKSLVAGAITDKGISTSANATFQQMATNIGQIETNNLPSWLSECDIYNAVSSYNEYRPFFVLASEKYIIPVIHIESVSDIDYLIDGSNYDGRYSMGVFLLDSGTLIRLTLTSDDDYDEMSIYCTDGNFEFGYSFFSENNLRFFVCKN